MINRRNLFLLIVAALALQWVVATGSPVANTLEITKDIVVTFVSSKPKFVSGLIATWIRIEAVDTEANTQEFFLPFLNKDIDLPSIGSACKITYVAGSVTGYVASESSQIHKKKASIVKVLDCRK